MSMHLHVHRIFAPFGDGCIENIHGHIHVQTNIGCWKVLIDAAKGCATQPPDLTRYPADFVVISFYKIFGYPTGLGALVVKKEAAALLEKAYFSGGTVVASISDLDYVKRRKNIEDLFEDGTQSFLGIASLRHGFKLINMLSLPSVERHTSTLNAYVRKALLAMRHENGSLVCVLYGLNDAKGQGPTIAFNLKRPDGTWYGYHEVEKLASLSGIQLRTGCFCNPGACAKYLGLSHSELFSNIEAGHVCWDDYDVLHGKPTGAVRISFGYMSTFEDAKKFIDFIEKAFVSKASPSTNGSHLEVDVILSSSGIKSMLPRRELYLKTINIFPIKSCSGFSAESWPLSATGLLHDREWCLQSPSGEVLTQKKVPRMSLIGPLIDRTRGLLTVESPYCSEKLQIGLDISCKYLTRQKMNLHAQRYEFQVYNDEINQWFSEAIGCPCTLVRCCSSEVLPCTNGRTGSTCRDTDSKLNFVNEAQFLLVTEESVDDLNRRLKPNCERYESDTLLLPIDPIRFRPNLVIGGAEPYEEDDWKAIHIGKEHFSDLVTGKRIGIGLVSDGLYRLSIRVVTALMSAVSKTEKKEEECRQLFLFWHERLGHLPFGILKHLFPELCSSLNIFMLSCDVCQFAKHVRASYPISNSRSNKAFSLVHSDVWGPSGIHSRGGFQYFITFIDDYSRCIFVYLLKDRSEVPHIIETFILLVENQYKNSVKTFGLIMLVNICVSLLKNSFERGGLFMRHPVVIPPPQNGVAERKNRQLLNVTRAILFQRNLPKYYWGDAILTSVYLINRMPSRGLKGRTPYSMLPGSSQPFHLPPRVFGCVCFIHNHIPNVKKLYPKSIKGIFLGYSSTQKGYKCLDPTTGRLQITKEGDDKEEIARLKGLLSTEFDLKDLGKLKYFLGIEIARSGTTLVLSQRKYTLDLLNETGKLGCRPASTPIDAGHKLGSKDGELLCEEAKGRYQRLVGKLIYLTLTRPDITFAVNVMSQFMHAPTDMHLKAVDRILCYLKKNPGKRLLYVQQRSLEVEGYSDANWAGCVDTRRSTSGYCVYLGGNLVVWRSNRQDVCSRSSAEAEYRAVATGVSELLWLKILLTDIGIEIEGPMRMYCDNKSVINLANNPVLHDRTKHVEIDRHFIRERIDAKELMLPYMKSEDQTADILTKALSVTPFERNVSKLGMFDMYAQLEEEC
ncbi:retrovirus-related Pol polyprotein from transposon RE1 isoform X4 [Nymphaea colorata]|uniref:retrovirus-related Pol polyprotein from transposon RE1 isoform X4 n=1 Tax=Nymphaea colorata TaxID=210225 RepID=UPI00214E83A1|nr:retrovirus-related Pol polyprotein from transposon RE1 isoform X4 [Nymphaea colorata]